MPYKTTPVAGTHSFLLSNKKTGHVYGKTEHPLAMIRAIEISKHGIKPRPPQVSMSKTDLIKEHKNLIKVLETGTVAQRAKEASKQKKELAKYIKK